MGTAGPMQKSPTLTAVAPIFVIAVSRGNDRLFHGCNDVNHPLHKPDPVPVLLHRPSKEFGHVDARAKRLSRPFDDNDPDGLVHLKLKEGRAHFLREDGVEGVELVGAVQNDDPDLLFVFHDDALVCHGRPP